MEASTTSPIDTATRDLQALQRRDAAGMAECYADDAVLDFVATGIIRGSDGVREYFEGLFAAVSDSEHSYDIVAADGDTVVVQWRMRGTFDGAAFQGVEPTGKAVEMRGVDVMTIKDDRIAHNTVYYDGLEFARQIGMMPALDSPAERAMKSAFNATTKLRQRFSQR
jgi:steroid delta-isomerase-like uncharacterized protein